MAGACLAKLPHSCGTSDGLQVFAREDDDSVDGYCFSCSTYIRHPYGEEKKKSSLPKPKLKTQEEIEEEIKEVDSYPTLDVQKKRLRKETLEFFGVKTALSEEDGKTPTMLCYPYTRNGVLVGYKLKTLNPKRLWTIGDTRESDFFGWEQAISSGARKLVITEGEDDAMALHRTVDRFSKSDNKNYTAFVSLPRGAASASSFIVSKLPQIRKYFKEIAICFDTDEAGERATHDVCKAIPSIEVITVPSKDANQAVIDGKQKALYSALFKSSKPKNTRLIDIADLFEEAKEPPKYGELSYPWSHLNKAVRGIRLGHVTYIGAGTKMGKSEIVNALAAWFIKEHNIKIFMAKPEENKLHTVKLLAGKIVGKIFHDPEVPFDIKAFNEACAILDEHVKILDAYQHVGWETLKEDIIEAVQWGAKVVFIDPITNLTSGMPSSEANTMLEKITEEISILAMDYNIHVFIFCHLRAHEGNIAPEKRQKYYSEKKYIGLGNCPHEYGGDVLSSQFAGSRAMQRKCQTMIGFEGNRDPNIPEHEQNIRHFKILEEREFGAKGIYPVYWNPKTSLFREV